MPVEIKELHIHVLVNDQAQQSPDATFPDPALQVDAIVAECVEQVLNILKEKQER
jgi:hypothetical protein